MLNTLKHTGHHYKYIKNRSFNQWREKAKGPKQRKEHAFVTDIYLHCKHTEAVIMWFFFIFFKKKEKLHSQYIHNLKFDALKH